MTRIASGSLRSENEKLSCNDSCFLIAIYTLLVL